MPGVPGSGGGHGLPGDLSNDKGSRGDPGAEGLQGIKGMPGITGNRGITGFEGMSGNRVSRAILSVHVAYYAFKEPLHQLKLRFILFIKRSTRGDC